MAFQLSKKQKTMSEINVTPLVDVMLVLLVIFMVTAPLMLNGIKLSLPRTKEVNRINLTAKQVVLSFSRAGEYYLGKEKVLEEELLPEIMQKFKETGNDILYLRADYGMKYGKVTRLMSFLKRGGVTNIALVTEMDNMDNKGQ